MFFFTNLHVLGVQPAAMKGPHRWHSNWYHEYISRWHNCWHYHWKISFHISFFIFFGLKPTSWWLWIWDEESYPKKILGLSWLEVVYPNKIVNPSISLFEGSPQLRSLWDQGGSGWSRRWSWSLLAWLEREVDGMSCPIVDSHFIWTIYQKKKLAEFGTLNSCMLLCIQDQGWQI